MFLADGAQADGANIRQRNADGTAQADRPQRFTRLLVDGLPVEIGTAHGCGALPRSEQADGAPARTACLSLAPSEADRPTAAERRRRTGAEVHALTGGRLACRD